MMPQEQSPGPVVVGIDGSDESIHAMSRAVEVARWRGAALHVVHVNDVTPAKLHLKNEVVDTQDIVAEHRQGLHERMDEVVGGSGIDARFVGIDGDHAADGLVEYCDEVGGSVLVVGPRGRGRVKRALLGSTAHAVVNRSHCDVLVVRPGT